MNVHLHEIDSFTSGRLPLTIWYPGPFPYTAVVKRFLSSAIERDTPANHSTNRFVPIGIISWYLLFYNKTSFSSAFSKSTRTLYPTRSFLWQNLLQMQRHANGQQWPQTGCLAHWWFQQHDQSPDQTQRPHKELFLPELHGAHGQFSPLKSKKSKRRKRLISIRSTYQVLYL